ncbi:MAG: hypothetical protein WC725_04465 [Patescibacteria group bacterium]|jgi:cytochrome bd-type quinol oxidase subunit 2
MEKTARKLAILNIVIILILTVLEFPAPIGFEVRPQNNVSIYWLISFLTILLSEITAIFLLFKRKILGARLAILAGVLNIFQIIADQAHLMQPEIAPLGYLILEDSVGVFSIILIFLSLRILKPNKLESV